ncbi:MAG: DUF6745 domain-containing protein [Planctomycetota bacterium]|jgi:hypothetical protein
MIEKLTAEQEAQLAVYRDRWIGIGQSTAPTDRPKAEEGARLAYELAGLTAPNRILWTRSPQEGAIAVAVMMIDDAPTLTMEEIRVRARELAGSSEFESQVHSAVQSALYGQHDAHWLGYYEYFEKVCELDAPKLLRGLQTVAKNAGWWWPFVEVIVMSDRGVEIHQDDQGRLHNEDGPAYRYADGFSLYHVHGIKVPRDIIENPESITPERIENERNVEIRRIMILKMGMERYFEDAQFEEVSRDDRGTLYRREISGEPLQVVRVTNSTPEPDGTYKDYLLMVPPDVQTPTEAVAASFGLTPEQYNPDQET